MVFVFLSLQENQAPGPTSRQSKIVFWVAFTAAQAVLIAKGALLLARYATPRLSCDTTPDVEGSQIYLSGYGINYNSSGQREDVYRKRIIVMLLYFICSILRCIQYGTLGHGVYNFLYSSSAIPFTTSDMQMIRNEWKNRGLCCGIVMGSVMLLLSLSIPLVGILMEIKYTDLHDCEYDFNVFIMYCTVNTIRYLLDTTTLLTLLMATFAVRRIWFPDKIDCLDVILQNDTVSEEQNSVAIDHHKVLTYLYTRKGQLMERIVKIFDSWFLLPWITYLIAASLEATSILHPWKSHNKVPSALPTIYYALYNSNAIAQIFAAYILARLMDSYQHRYHNLMRKEQLRAAELVGPVVLHLARTLHIEEEERYKFMARFIACTNIRVQLRNPMLVIAMFLGVLVTVSGSLYLN